MLIVAPSPRLSVPLYGSRGRCARPLISSVSLRLMLTIGGNVIEIDAHIHEVRELMVSVAAAVPKRSPGVFEVADERAAAQRESEPCRRARQRHSG